MEMKNFISESIKLSIFMFFLLFLSGRFGLLLHEFAGHTLSWQLLGGKITDFYLFLFGGGWVHYGWTPKTDNLSDLSFVFVHLSGIAVELVVGVILAFPAVFFRTTRIVKAWLSVASSILLVHGLYYLVICFYYGSGDGRIIFDTIHGNVRHAFLIFTSFLTIGVAFFVSFTFSPEVKSWVPDRHSKNGFFLIIISTTIAILFHGMLTVSEQILVKDSAYNEIKTSVNDRLKGNELSEFLDKYAKEHGKEADQELVKVIADELEKKYRQFPIRALLGFLILVALGAGFIVSGNRKYCESSKITCKDNWILGSVSALIGAIIVALNSLWG